MQPTDEDELIKREIEEYNNKSEKEKAKIDQKKPDYLSQNSKELPVKDRKKDSRMANTIDPAMGNEDVSYKTMKKQGQQNKPLIDPVTGAESFKDPKSVKN